MPEIAEEYLFLFNAVADAESALENLHAQLVRAQRRAEELYLKRTDRECSQQSDGEPDQRVREAG